jgi:hypothetical protein
MPKAPEKEEFLIDGPAGKLQAMLEIPVGVEHPPRRVAIFFTVTWCNCGNCW